MSHDEIPSTSFALFLHPPNRVIQPVRGAIAAHVAAGAAAQATDGPAGYVRFPLSPPAWTPTDNDLSDPDVVKVIDTHISELQRVKKAIDWFLYIWVDRVPLG
jgi:hypothetical protein